MSSPIEVAREMISEAEKDTSWEAPAGSPKELMEYARLVETANHGLTLARALLDLTEKAGPYLDLEHAWEQGEADGSAVLMQRQRLRAVLARIKGEKEER